MDQVRATHPFHIWKQVGLHYNIPNSETVHNILTHGKVLTGKVQAKGDSEIDKRQGKILAQVCSESLLLSCLDLVSYLKILTINPPRVCVYVCAQSPQSCPTLCDPMDCSPPGSSTHGIFQVIVLDWVAISFSRGSS